MLKKLLFFISLVVFLNQINLTFAEIIPLKKPIQSQEQKEQKLLIDVLKPLPKPVTKKEIEKEKESSSPPSSDDDPSVVRSEINDIRKSVVSMSVGQPDRTTTIVKEWLEQPEPAPPVEGVEKVLKPSEVTKLKEVFATLEEDVNKYESFVEEARVLQITMPTEVMWMMIVKNIFLLENLVTTKPILEGCNGKKIREMLLDCRRMLCEGEIRSQRKGKFRAHTARNDTAD